MLIKRGETEMEADRTLRPASRVFFRGKTEGEFAAGFGHSWVVAVWFGRWADELQADFPRHAAEDLVLFGRGGRPTFRVPDFQSAVTADQHDLALQAKAAAVLFG